MPGEVAEIALITDNLGLPDSPARGRESETFERAKSGDVAAFEQIFDRYQRKVLLTAWRILGNREDARDAAQEVFLRVYKYLGRFQSDQDFAAWLYRIIVNVCRDHARKRGRREQFTSYEAEHRQGSFDSMASAEDVEASLLRSQQQAMIAEALDSLSVKERAAIVLRDLDGLTTEEVARALGSSQATVRSQISTARAKIKKFKDRALNRTRRG
jgi:RNA polymerase sigma-70 factor (ECF subfamily)